MVDGEKSRQYNNKISDETGTSFTRAAVPVADSGVSDHACSRTFIFLLSASSSSVGTDPFCRKVGAFRQKAEGVPKIKKAEELPNSGNKLQFLRKTVVQKAEDMCSFSL